MCNISVNINNKININDSDNNFISNPSLKIDHVHLKVSNLENSINFYKKILGFTILDHKSDENVAYLGTKSTGNETFTLLILTQTNEDNQKKSSSLPANRIKTEAGLYHFAILLPERKYLASFLTHIQNNLDSQFYEGMADHAVSESVYLHDPDYNGIEVYRDRKASEWTWLDKHKVYMTTAPLNAQSLLYQHGNEKWDGLPVHTTIGHVHLFVSNLIKAKSFYNDLLGLYQTASFPGAYFFAADGYHHHVATNTWMGTNLLPNSADDYKKTGLAHYAISIPYDKEEIKRLKNHLFEKDISIHENMNEGDKNSDLSFYIYDPFGIKIQFLFN